MISSSSSSSGFESDESDFEERPLNRRRNSSYHIIDHLADEFTSYEESFEDLFGIKREYLFDLHNEIYRDIIKNHTCFPRMRPIRPRDRIGICLRYLRSGSSFQHLSFTYNLHANVIETIVCEVCNTITNYLQPQAMPYQARAGSSPIVPCRNFALNESFIRIMKDRRYVMISMVDLDQEIVMMDIVYCGRPPGQDVFDKSPMAAIFKNMHSHETRCLKPRRYQNPLPNVSDDGSLFLPKAYTLSKHKENTDPLTKSANLAVKHLRNRWQILQTNISVPLAMAKVIVLTTCCLQNYLVDTR